MEPVGTQSSQVESTLKQSGETSSSEGSIHWSKPSNLNLVPNQWPNSVQLCLPFTNCCYLFLSPLSYPFSNLFSPNLPSVDIIVVSTRTSQPHTSHLHYLYIPLCCLCISTSSPLGRLAEADSPKTTSMVLLSTNSFTQGQYSTI